MSVLFNGAVNVLHVFSSPRGSKTVNVAMLKKRGHTCLIVSGMATLFLLMMVLYGTIGTQQPGSSFRRDYQLLGRPLYKLDLNWPKSPELFTGDVFAVAVNQYSGVVYVAQRGNAFLSPGFLVDYFQRINHSAYGCFAPR